MQIINLELPKFNIKKLDGRYTGHRFYDYRVHTSHHGHRINHNVLSIESFNMIRSWCIQTWGNSCELEDIEMIYSYPNIDNSFVNKNWAYSTITKTRRIYLTKESKIWFDLRWL
jgi:hypothetical protein